ncbi:lipopolysaccharide assembly protein LapB [Marinihelvus fidelis]|uniref:Lipopolysaccharide assembly protein B n=1 Tax=Marinihelvus fidelis TaxID=2613842 RepID=A0A5N0TAL8_9GAMM|nr:lipopolysaccharide assembly protein LapB [Marinihelvus fidelis]KAA9132055.1 lipopolysaccharide assembly protein LapB [Marinihelvus fidelis]
MIEALWVLSVIAAALLGGWFARKLSRRGERKRNRVFSRRYFQGLNYLLSEQPDKAIQVFLEMAEVNKDTVETHLALGSLFRRRGEVDRAIRLHQNIISKHNLDESQRTKALLELGEDYMRAGLFDRAERLFSELTQRGAHAPPALRHLLDIYQQEKDWPKSLEMAEKLEALTGERMGAYMAHFCCELAEKAIQEQAFEDARKQLRAARRHDPQSIRARLLLARIARLQAHHSEALDLYEEIVDMDSDFIPQVLEDYLACAQAAGEEERVDPHLRDWCERHRSTSAVLKLAAMIQEADGIDAAAQFLADELSRNPSVRGLDRLIELKLNGGPEIESGDEILRAVAQRLLARQPTHRCAHCGYSGHTHYWQCPSCKQWGTTRVIHGVLGD